MPSPSAPPKAKPKTKKKPPSQGPAAAVPPQQRHGFIEVDTANTHNLKGISLSIPKRQLVVLTGVSGSGKSSLAFDTLYHEAQRRYVDTLGDYAKQFLGSMAKAPVKRISGLSPSIAIEQKTTQYTPRSTVGTVTEILDYLRVLYARVGTPHCPHCAAPIEPQSAAQLVQRLWALAEGTKLQVLAPVVRGRKGDYSALFTQLRKEGFSRVRIDGTLQELDELPEVYKLDRYKLHHVEVVVDRIVLRHESDTMRLRLEEAVQRSLKKAEGYLLALWQEPKQTRLQEQLFSQHLSCLSCHESFGEMAPRRFSFNSPYGACPSCQGLGVQRQVVWEQLVPSATQHLSLLEGGMPLLKKLMGSYQKAFCVALEDTFLLPVSKPLQAWSQSECRLLLYGLNEGNSEAMASTTAKRQLKELRQAGAKAVWGSDEDDDNLASMADWDQWLDDFAGLSAILLKRMESAPPQLRRSIEACFTQSPCPTCEGTRLNAFALAVTLGGRLNAEGEDDVTAPLTFKGLLQHSVEGLHQRIQTLWSELSPQALHVGHSALKEVEKRLHFLVQVGLGYLSLGRSAATLSGGEAQRIRLAGQIGSGLQGVLYVLDEPSIGLHAHNNQQLIDTLKTLRDQGNTVLVVEHDEEMIRQADWVVDIGPHAGRHGGQLLYSGPPEGLEAVAHSLTGAYLTGAKAIVPNLSPSQGNGQALRLQGLTTHNLKGMALHIPLGTLTTLTGLSGSGKSTVVFDCLFPLVQQHLQNTTGMYGRKKRLKEGEAWPALELPQGVGGVSGLEAVDKLVVVDQSPIGKSSRSNPATYTGMFDAIRQIYAGTAEAKTMGLSASHFSFNSPRGGRCPACQGSGQIAHQLGMLPTAYVQCQTCQGSRYQSHVLRVRYHGLTIAQLLETPIEEALPLFAAHSGLSHQLQVLVDVGLGYLALGQGAPLLSGGEAQRLKLATELMRKPIGHTLYLLDEPSVGLHWEDLQHFLAVVQRLVGQGHTVLAIEHHLDFVAASDWVIDLGPGGGAAGGQVVAQGTVAQVAANPASLTGHYLHQHLQAHGHSKGAPQS